MSSLQTSNCKVSAAPLRGQGGASTGPKEKKYRVAKTKAKSTKKADVKTTEENAGISSRAK
jgi:hypothetical protein